VGFEPTISAGERPQTLRLRPRGYWDRQHFCSEIISRKIDNSAVLMWGIRHTRESVSGLLNPFVLRETAAKFYFGQHDIQHRY